MAEELIANAVRTTRPLFVHGELVEVDTVLSVGSKPGQGDITESEAIDIISARRGVPEIAKKPGPGRPKKRETIAD